MLCLVASRLQAYSSTRAQDRRQNRPEGGSYRSSTLAALWIFQVGKGRHQSMGSPRECCPTRAGALVPHPLKVLRSHSVLTNSSSALQGILPPQARRNRIVCLVATRGLVGSKASPSGPTQKHRRRGTPYLQATTAQAAGIPRRRISQGDHSQALPVVVDPRGPLCHKQLIRRQLGTPATRKRSSAFSTGGRSHHTARGSAPPA